MWAEPKLFASPHTYKKALDKIKEDEYITDEQKDTLRKEVQDTINIIIGIWFFKKPYIKDGIKGYLA